LILQAAEEITHNNTAFKFVIANELDWTQIFEDTHYLAIPNITPIEYTGENER